MGAQLGRQHFPQGSGMALPILDGCLISFGAPASSERTSAFEVYGGTDRRGKYSSSLER